MSLKFRGVLLSLYHVPSFNLLFPESRTMKRLILVAIVVASSMIVPESAEACRPGKAILRGAARIVSAPFRAAKANRSRRAGRSCN